MLFRSLDGTSTAGDLIDFGVHTGVVTVTADQNFLLEGGAGTTDVLNYTATGAGTMKATAFEIVNFTTAAQGSAAVVAVGAVTVTSAVAQAGLTVATATTSVTTTNPTATAAIIIDAVGNVTNTTFTHNGVGTAEYRMEGDTSKPDTIVQTGSGAITVKQDAAAGVTDISLNSTNAVIDRIEMNFGSAAVVAAVDRVTVSGFNPAQDIIGLDIDATSVSTAASANATTQIGATGALTVQDVDVLT